jgi:hypothetical protein
MNLFKSYVYDRSGHYVNEGIRLVIAGAIVLTAIFVGMAFFSGL